MRQATQADSERLFAWRNDPDTRAASRNIDPVTEEEHARWLERVLGDPERILLIAQAGDEAVGQVRFDRLGPERWEISVTVAPAARGRGLGRDLIAAGVAWLWRTDVAAAVVEAWVRAGNERSRRAFRAAGFEPSERERGGLLELELRRREGGDAVGDA
jgi:RimJ/RimL family protein N-acetyltransferase